MPPSEPHPQSPAPVTPDSPGSGYDLLAQQLIPGYASLARLSVALLAASPRASIPGAAVLVAGCGTGAELQAAREQRPDWRLTALDPSTEMLAIARTRLGPACPIDWRCTAVEDLRGEPVFDGALSVLVLQSLPDDGGKLAFKIFKGECKFCSHSSSEFCIRGRQLVHYREFIVKSFRNPV